MNKKYVEAIKVISQEIWGEPKLKNDDEWRFGNKLSKAIDIKNATYFDFEENEGGGLIDLITKAKNLSGIELSNYLLKEFDIEDADIDVDIATNDDINELEIFDY